MPTAVLNIINEIEKFKKYLCLEAIVNFLSKFGKKIYENKNINNFKYLNYFIGNSLNTILKNESLPGFLKYKIINLIEKQKNQWKDSLYEKSILAKGKDNNNNNNIKRKSCHKKDNNSLSSNKSHRTRKRRHSNKSLKSVSPDNSFSIKNNTLEPNIYDTYNNFELYKNYTNRDSIHNGSPLIKRVSINTNDNNEEIIKIIKKDIQNYELFLKDNYINNKYELSIIKNIGNKYDWSIIEDILLKNNMDLAEIIRCYVEVCIDKISDISKIFISNDYIKNIIYYYSSNLTNKEKDIIHNKMINLYMNIQDICIDNLIMLEIMGYLLFILIENKLYFIKDLNNFINLDKEIVITIANAVKYAIISSGSKCKKYHNDFKQTKLFVDNTIFNEFVTNKIQDLLN